MMQEKSHLLIFDRQLMEDRTYWMKKLVFDNPPAQIKLDFPRPEHHSDQSASLPVNITGDLYQCLQKVTGGGSFLLYTVLMAALKVGLYKYTSETTIVVGSPAHRQHNALNALTLISQIDSRLSFRQFLLSESERLKEAYARQRYPFDRLLRDLRVDHITYKCPLFDIALVLTDLHGDLPPVKNDITFIFTQTPEQITGQVIYNSSIFQAETIRRFANHILNGLRDGLADTNKTLAEMSILDAAERRQILFEWNSTAAEYPRDRCVHQWFERQVEQTPDAIALECGEHVLTYRELNQQANQVAHNLKEVGVGPEVLVGICLERSIAMVVGLLGILKAGGAYLPLDPSYPQERIKFMLEDAHVPVILTQSKLVERLQADANVKPETTCPPMLICLDTDWERISLKPKENPICTVRPEHLAYVIYTSGSTGKPKGAMILHRGLMNYLHWAVQTYAVAEGNGSPVQSPITFDATITSLYTPLLVGKRVVLLPDNQELETLCAALCAHRQYSLLKITPAHLDVLNQLVSPEVMAGQTNVIVLGGEALLGPSVLPWRTHAPQTRIINEYGPTETVVGCCVYEVSAQTSLSGAVPIGRPIANTQLYILDRDMQPVPVGVTGELYIGGDGVARGYLNRPELTQERFLPDPFRTDPEARLYKTGDLACYLPEGTIEFLGRVDYQVNLRGYRIELGEVEAALRDHPAVQESAVLARQDRPGDTRLVAYLVQNHTQLPTDDELRAFLRVKLPDYMLPSAFVVLDTLPLTPNGKVDRRALPSPETALRASHAYIAPRNDAEKTMATIWTEVLGQSPIGIYDNFFAIGGHSLLATQVISRLFDAFQVELPLRTLFEEPTIASLVERIETIQWITHPPQTSDTISGQPEERGRL